MVDMFYYCTSLTNIPLLDTSKVTDMTDICNNCINVESGALALYQQASNQTTPPSEYNRAFRDCGINTQTGSAELAQIPSDWK
jgi:surface protein